MSGNTQIPMRMDVKIYPLNDGGNVLAKASVTLNGCFAIRGVRVVDGKDGVFDSMPSYKTQEGYKNICFPYAAYIPGMRDIVNAEMNRAAEFIVRQGIAESERVCWNIRFGELEKSLGLTIREGSGLDSMLRAALKQQPEVAAVDMHDGCIEMEYHPEYCQRLKKDDQPGLRLKELLPLLKGSGLIFLCHEEAERSVLAEESMGPTMG